MLQEESNNHSKRKAHIKNVRTAKHKENTQIQKYVYEEQWK